MSEVWSIFVNKINKFNQKIIRYSVLIIKSIISSTKNLSIFSIKKIEVNKLKWELNKEKQKLGDYILKCQRNDIYDFSNDPQFYKLIDKVKEIENFLKNKEN
ncbi:MAG: hypothetical protein CMG21_00745 [Candidatus Marinimicrobia bacterium]|nr:hypothetical protein [Candidatus Neomarinimicrobiota bacterium]